VALSKHNAATVADRIADLIEHIQDQFEISLTIHDRFGIFIELDHPVIMQRLAHQHPFCAFERKIWNANCVRDCQKRCGELAQDKAAPFVFDCWKGGRQVVVPMIQDGVYVATLFAGIFRGTMKKNLDRAIKDKQGELPVLYDAEKLATTLHFLVKGMLAELFEHRELANARGNRKEQILHFLRLNAPRPIFLKDLATELCLSASHTSHLVTELFGRSFQTLLLQERIRRAQGYLRTTEFSLATIAEQTGFKSVYYFGRQFKQIVGMPPGKYREANQRV